MIRHLFNLAAGIYALLTAPLVAELAVLSVAATLPRKPPAPGNGTATGHPTPPSRPFHLWIILPAHNEQRLIADSVHSLRQQACPEDHILVVAHNCTDSTAMQAQAAGAMVLDLHDSGAGGKGSALAAGFAFALNQGANQGADAVLIVDADSVVSPGCLPRVRSALISGAAALQCRYVARNGSDSPRTSLLALALTGMNVVRPLGRARLGLSAGIFGNGFALSAETLRAVPYAARSVVEDLEYHLLLLQSGRRVHFLPDAEVQGELPTGTAAAGTQRARWEGGRMRLRREWAVPLLSEVLRGRLRMVEPLLDLLSVPLIRGLGWLLIGLALSLLGSSPWLRLYFLLGLLSVLFYAAVAASLGPSPLAAARGLAALPSLVWLKVKNRAATRQAARHDSAWVRTERND